MNIDEAAKKYADEDWFLGYETDIEIAFKDGALSDTAKQYWYEQFKSEQKQSAGVWIKASQLKQIDYPICIKYDGGGAPCYTTICSINELVNLTTDMNPLDEIYFLDETP